MRSREEIEKDFRPSGRTSEGIHDKGDLYFFVDIIDNQKLILEALLDIRDSLFFKARKGE